MPGRERIAPSDDIAYNNHDIDDGLRAGLFEIADLMTRRWSARCSRS
jgi:dGTPase